MLIISLHIWPMNIVQQCANQIHAYLFLKLISSFQLKRALPGALIILTIGFLAAHLIYKYKEHSRQETSINQWQRPSQWIAGEPSLPPPPPPSSSPPPPSKLNATNPRPSSPSPPQWQRHSLQDALVNDSLLPPSPPESGVEMEPHMPERKHFLGKCSLTGALSIIVC